MSQNEQTDDEIIAQAQERLTEARKLLAQLPTDTMAPLTVKRYGARGDGPPIFFCAGGCKADVAIRGSYCPKCADEKRREERAVFFAPARESLSPNGALDWCRVGRPEYIAGTKRAIECAKHCADPKRAMDLIQRAVWKRDNGNLLFVGPQRIGKTNTVIAIGNRLLDAAERPQLTRDDLDFLCGIRFVTGLDLARARSETSFGHEPALIRRAKNATLLILDEIGFEDDKFDPHAVRDVVYHRYRMGRSSPTLVTSGCTVAELAKRYGAAMVERLTDLGELIDLHKS